MKYTLFDFAQMIDHVNVKANVTEEALIKLCEEAKQYHFKIVAINSVNTAFCYQQVIDSDVSVGAAISFPYGSTTIESKVFETQQAIQQGSREIDYVLNIGKVLDHDYAYIEKEMKAMVELCHQHQVICKVILETSYLSDEEIVQCCQIAKRVKPDFVKTSTGTTQQGATLEHIKLIKSVVGDTVGVKASGGIRDADFFLDLVRAGATRLGASAGIKILDEIKQKMATLNTDTLEI